MYTQIAFNFLCFFDKEISEVGSFSEKHTSVPNLRRVVGLSTIAKGIITNKGFSCL